MMMSAATAQRAARCTARCGAMQQLLQQAPQRVFNPLLRPFASLRAGAPGPSGARAGGPPHGRPQNRKEGRRGQESAPRPGKGDPVFPAVWRQFQMRVHPDLFARFPELMAKNQDSLQKLQGVLNEAKSGQKTVEEMMKPRTEDLEFYVRTETDNAFLRVVLSLRLPGGHCPDSLAASLAPLFAACKLPTRFHWGPEYWNSSYAVTDEVPEEYEEARQQGEGEEGAGQRYGNPRRAQRRWEQ